MYDNHTLARIIQAFFSTIKFYNWKISVCSSSDAESMQQYRNACQNYMESWVDVISLFKTAVAMKCEAEKIKRNEIGK